jgi:two-component system, chemotaxis family, CheB/CheR fusion protein
VQLFATDVNDTDIARARIGIYPPTIATEMSELRLKRFFDQVPDGYQVKKALREMCIFAKHDVTRHPPFTRLDFLLRRNMLIHFRPPMQESLIPLFHYALHPSGFLALGTSESVGRHGSLFEFIDKKNRVYARRPGRGELPFEFGQALSLRPAEVRAGGKTRREISDMVFDVTREADRIAAGAYAPASVVTGEDLRILNFRGDTSPYLSHPPGAGTAAPQSGSHQRPDNLRNLLANIDPIRMLDQDRSTARTRSQRSPLGHLALRKRPFAPDAQRA